MSTYQHGDGDRKFKVTDISDEDNKVEGFIVVRYPDLLFVNERCATRLNATPKNSYFSDGMLCPSPCAAAPGLVCVLSGSCGICGALFLLHNSSRSDAQPWMPDCVR